MDEIDREQSIQLNDHTDRLHELEDQLANVFPSPATPAGSAQRVRLEVPTPSTVMTLGARGVAASSGRPIGPGGVAFRTVENFGAEVLGGWCVDVDGLTTTHSIDAMRFVTQADFGLASQDALRIGTAAGHVEMTAGDVVPNDPAFTVVPDLDIPDPPEVDTAQPRQGTETARTAWGRIWKSLETAAKTWSFLRRPTGSPPTVAPHAAQVVQRVFSYYGLAQSLLTTAIELAESAAEADEGTPEGPEVKIHGAGGVSVTSPHGVDAFGARKAKLHSPIKASVEGGHKVSLKSPIYAGVYGGMMAKLKSEGVAAVSARHCTVSGTTAELKGYDIASVASGTRSIVHSANESVVSGQTVAIAGREVHASAQREMRVSSQRSVRVIGSDAVGVQCGEDGSEAAKLTLNGSSAFLVADNGDTRLEMQRNEIRFKPGGSLYLLITRDHLEAGRFMVRRNETTIRGNVNLG